MAIEANHVSFQGEDVIHRVTVVDAGGTAVNILGWTFAAQWRRTEDGSADLSYTSSGTPAISISDAPTGLVDITIPKADTLTLGKGVYSYAVNRTNAGSEAVLEHGRWTFLRTIVR